VGDRTLGELCVVRNAGKPFDPDEARALTLLANSAAVAIVNARLIEAQKRQAAQAGTLAERERLAAELHDHLAQMLGFLNLETDRVKAELSAGETEAAGGTLDRMKAAIGQAYRQVRAALVDLRESPTGTDDLADKLEGCLADFRQASGLPAELVVADSSALSLPRLSQTQALLIVREALINTRRHAQARRVSVRVDRVEGYARFTIEDDGRGFDPSSLTGNDHLGLAIMQTRAERSGGRLAVRSVPGTGTQVTAYLPLGAPAPGDGDSGEP
jgi:signal transduction histidine kinase